MEYFWFEEYGSNLKSDVLLLADVFENFRKTCLQYQKIRSTSLFHFSWSKLELMTDVHIDRHIGFHICIPK